MMNRKSAFKITRWEEVENDHWEGGKLTRTLATKEFTGEFEGTAVLEAIMLRLSGEDGVMSYVGVERIQCTIEGREGTFILTHHAEARHDGRQATWKILPGSGTGGLTGIHGSGSITPNHDFILTYAFDEQ
ncbi:DUF3224 domain-containing protein [Verminephrobacter aporrectodeae subsp. tuberculatae]|uniref:DUF3224 domain-containing protein n=1 Tax=Verminephrobacter aporrectodeae subsp. tuberculatae TaxID=1110392 RepID=A0ABT3KVJ3_9BURK|nr:DUF3224 domain-containing protein [Verminephrobacter aporrectodeae]MCW5321934.1 DUF3224 domain-containing protein [Verminephrobacter aporrectodeae subsp. tuberculatae]MCW8199654.1 DUF3224 domain-containing protein [Verminephrobacter aporrectodeae subsp. tuberculatae]